MKLLNDYSNFIKKFNMVGSNVVFVNNAMEIETVCTGHSSLEKNILTNFDSIYRIASISKVIVAIGVLKLYEQGLVDLDEDISKYFGFKIRNPKYEDTPITLRMIMTQTSSIVDDGGYIDGIYKGYDGSNSTDDFIQVKSLLTPGDKHYGVGYSDYKPGTNFIYSNF